MPPPRAAPRRAAPRRTAPHRTAPHRTAQHRTAPHRSALQIEGFPYSKNRTALQIEGFPYSKSSVFLSDHTLAPHLELEATHMAINGVHSICFWFSLDPRLPLVSGGAS